MEPLVCRVVAKYWRKVEELRIDLPQPLERLGTALLAFPSATSVFTQ